MRTGENRMNILLCVNSFLPTVGGKEMVVHYLAQALNALGHQVRVMCPGGWRSDRHVRFAYPVHRWPTLKGLLEEPVWFAQLFSDALLFGCDIIHAHITYPSGYMAALVKRITHTPLIITPHGEDIHVVPEIGRGLRLCPRLRSRIDRALQDADRVTAISAGVRASLTEAGVPDEKIRDIPNGTDADRFRGPVREDVWEWLGLSPASKLIITVGNYRPVKGHELLIQAMPEILAKEPRARLVIVGGGTDALRPLIRSLHLDDQVVLTGAIAFPIIPSPDRTQSPAESPEPDWLAALYRSSRVYVSAGIGEGAEGLPLSVLDALAACLPVVASDISGNREVIRDGESGFLIPAGDASQIANAVLRILTGDELHTQMRERARAVAAQYEWREIARRYLEVYHEALESVRGRKGARQAVTPPGT